MYFGGMNSLDIVILICLSYGLIRGLIKGFVVEIAGVIALLVGILGAFKFSNSIAVFIQSHIEIDPKIVQVVSFLLLFIVIVYGISLLAKMLTKTLQIIALGLLNRMAGGIFGVCKWVVILSALLICYQQIDSIITILPEKVIRESVTFNYLSDIASFLFDWVNDNNSLLDSKFI